MAKCPSQSMPWLRQYPFRAACARPLDPGVHSGGHPHRAAIPRNEDLEPYWRRPYAGALMQWLCGVVSSRRDDV